MEDIRVSDLIQRLSTDWKTIIEKVDCDTLETFLTHERQKHHGTLDILPEPSLIFKAFDMFPCSELKAVIIGQDAYQNKGLPMGLSFSVPEIAHKCPPSLRNVFKEIQHEFGGVLRTQTDLTDWAQQGVMLLNAGLTVLEGKSGSHLGIWEPWTRAVLKEVVQQTPCVVYMLWGNYAQEFESVIQTYARPPFLVLKHTHPSPLSRKPFVGNGHFKLCNEFLQQHGRDPIKWA
jgi:uracil-DNA glycosylase